MKNLSSISRIEKFLKIVGDEDLPYAYGYIIKELRDHRIIRSRNVIGDIGEYLVIKYYNETPGLPNLSPAQPRA